jgi:hypothetical protein
MKIHFWFAPLLLILATSAGAQTVYRWKDASGQTHYSQTPPTTGQYDVMQGGRAPSSSLSAAATPAPAAPAPSAASEQREKEKKFIEDAEAARKAKAAAKEKEKTAKAEKDQRCKAAREMAQFLEERTARRLVTKADDGNYARMNEDEFMKKLDAAKKDEATNCS